MEKTNKCGVSYPCWGNQATCKYFEEEESKYHKCKWLKSGQCICKEAQKEAVSEN